MKAPRKPALAGSTLLHRYLPLLITATYIGFIATYAGLLAAATAMALSDNDMLAVAATASITAGATAVMGVLARILLPRG